MLSSSPSKAINMSPLLTAESKLIVSVAYAEAVDLTVPIGNLKGHPLSSIIPDTDPVKVCCPA